ncbi:hypothetical protein EYF80_052002 [Liparis tanakae]|uniref:Uncharacterized protein n=1 Tax=Liparis tanakae TaxID=230148 RepID=A0A4Z2FAC7_9TELE|nr:hypothetical protein EYF80_052002 [Liparis tanakae]
MYTSSAHKDEGRRTEGETHTRQLAGVGCADMALCSGSCERLKLETSNVGSLEDVYTLRDSRGRPDRAAFQSRLSTAIGREMDL